MSESDGPELDERVLERLADHEKGDLMAAARVAHEMGFWYLCSLYLMELEVQS